MNMDTMLPGVVFAAGAAVATAVLSVRAASRPPPASAAPHAPKSVFLDANAPVDAEGRVHHLHVKHGEVANRVLSVGDVGRAARISKALDASPAVVEFHSSRGFVTHTGCYNGVPISIIATGMGTPMIDFVARETRAVVTGPMAILRYGTCGGLHGTTVGSIVVTSEGAVMVRRSPDAVTRAIAARAAAAAGVEQGASASGGRGVMRSDSAPPMTGRPTHVADESMPYEVSGVIAPDERLAGLFVAALRDRVEVPSGGKFPVVPAIGASADSFYSSQGRSNPYFNDCNEDLLDFIEFKLPTCACLEMESAHLLDVARCTYTSPHSHVDAPSRANDTCIHACAAHIAIVNRRSKDVLSAEDLTRLELEGGRAALDALSKFPL